MACECDDSACMCALCVQYDILLLPPPPPRAVRAGDTARTRNAHKVALTHAWRWHVRRGVTRLLVT
jgi:hypothetical protein